LKIYYELAGMGCGACVNKVTQALLQIPGVEEAAVQLKPQSVLITMSRPIYIAELQDQLNKTGNYTIKISTEQVI